MANKSNLQTFLRVSMILLAMAGLAQAAAITIGPGAGYDFDTIQAGIDAANDTDTVLVAPGEYVITEPVMFKGKAITVKSEAGPDETTIRMGTPADSNRGSVVVFESNENEASVLDGFTIADGKGCECSDPYGERWSGSFGGGIMCWEASSTIVSCTIIQNSAVNGAGVGCLNSDAILIDCMIMENLSQYSGGFCAASGSSPTLTDCIFKGNSATGNGGAIMSWDDSSLTVTNCTITGNSAGNVAGGIWCWENASITMTDCIIRDNSAGESGGGLVRGANSTVNMTRCAVIGNTAQGYGAGGMDCADGSGTLTNCVIAMNTAVQWGGGLLCVYPGSSTTVRNCTIWGNSGGEGGGGVGCFDGASATITNSIIWANTAAKGPDIFLEESPTEFSITYSNVAGGQTAIAVEGGSILNWGVGNIDAEPCLANPTNDDYHLKSQAGRWDPNNQVWRQDEVTSPCIDGGYPDSDWTAELWPHGVRVNMGAYGGTLQASRSLSDAGNVADVNRNGIVDSVDMCIMVDHWNTDETYCDIAPAPFGDGIVDVKDLIVLAENLFEDSRIIAHLKLDETEGNIAYDNTGNYNATLNGNPIWRATSGKINGALEFDGVDDYVSSPFVLNAMDTTFSAFTWIKWGEPGQVIISQTNGTGFGATWLCSDVQGGKLMTSLMDPQPALVSESIIIDGTWHHIGLVWDQSYRYLYVDGAEVAKDISALSYTVPCDGGLYIGAGKDLDTATFFSGLIDDIRVYNQALSAEEIEALAR